MSANEAINLIEEGNRFDAEGDKEAAAEAYLKATQEDETLAVAFANLGGALYELGRYEESAEASQKAIDIEPESAMAWVNLGNVKDLLGDFEAAQKCYLKALEIAPDYTVALGNLGNALFAQGKHEQALEACNKALALDPRDVNALINAGNASDALGLEVEAKQFFERAAKIDNNNWTIFNNLGAIYEKLGEHAKAENSYWRTLEISPDYSAAHLSYGYLLYELVGKGMAQRAKQYAERWKNRFGQNPVVEHMAAAIMVGDVPARAGDAYIKELFNAFAPDFDKSLANLEYAAPQLIEHALDNFSFNKGENLAVLDAGCGTGLCAKMARKIAQKGEVIGVDLSPLMLEKAKEREIYNELIENDLILFMQQNQARFDVVVSADVFTYFGALEELFSSMFLALKSNGFACFTITRRKKPTPKGYLLNASGRYSHNQDYVEKTLKDVGFSVELMEEVVLRKEGGEPVWGWVVIAKRNS